MNFDDYLLKLQSIAKIGLKYSKDPYAIENYIEVESLSKEMIEKYFNQELSRPNYFIRDVYPTPNISVRVVIMNEQNQVLMVQEAMDGGWSLPGGWCDLGETASESAIKEVLQETGFEVEIERLLGLLCYSKRFNTASTFGYTSAFKARIIGGEVNPCHEVLQVQYFDLDNLPPLSFKISSQEFEAMLEVAVNDLPAIFD